MVNVTVPRLEVEATVTESKEVSVVVRNTEIESNLNIGYPLGVRGQKGDPGPRGEPGRDGTDGEGVPPGGSAGQLLAKVSGSDFDTEWIASPPAPLNCIARKNLLDNWYFLHPVNQRGADTYRGSWTVYTIDRWMTVQDYPISITADGLNLNNNTNSNAYLHQRIDNELTKSLLGKTLTISIVKANGMAYSGTAKMPVSLPDAETTKISVSAGGIYVYFVLNKSGQSFGSRYTISVPAGVSETIVACKLEIGDSQTLWHTENEDVILSEIPDYGEQLRRCRRYYTVLNGNSAVHLDFGGFVTSNTTVYVNTGIEEMRATPSVTFTGGIIIRGVSGYSTDASYSNPCTNPAVTALNNGFALMFRKADSSAWDGLTSNTPIGLTNTAGTKIELSADL